MIVRFDVNPLIITLAMGSVYDGIAFWLPDQQTIPGISTQPRRTGPCCTTCSASRSTSGTGS